MLKNITLIDKLFLLSALLSIAYSEIIFFQGYKLEAIFVGVWVPSILSLAAYLKLIIKEFKKNE